MYMSVRRVLVSIKIVSESCFVEVQYKSTILYHAHGKMVCTTDFKMLCPLYLEIDTTKIYGEINIKICVF